MAILVSCDCGRRLSSADEFAGARAECPFCGRMVQIPRQMTEASNQAFATAVADNGPSSRREALERLRRKQVETAAEITDFLDPPVKPPSPSTPNVKRPSVLRRMFEALLDPRSIQWLLTLGGALAVLGLIVWLVSLGIFESSLHTAIAFAVGTLGVLGAGWSVTLKTKYKTAGRALTFLGCVVAPLNLWFYHAQGLLSVDGHLWVGAAICCLAYVATVIVLRDPLFIYAIEAGVTLTVLLLLADLGRIADPTWLSLFAMVLGLLSLHTERAFSNDDSAEFSRRRYGRPLFECGHLQIASSLLILLGVQVFGWFYEPISTLLQGWNVTPSSSLIANSRLLALGIWLAGAYAYLYSDLVIRRTGRDIYNAAFCLIMAELTALFHTDMRSEWLITALALTALVANVIQLLLVRRESDAFDRTVPRIGLLLNALPLILGFVLHVRATWDLAANFGWAYETGWPFVIAMATVAACNRLAAWLYRDQAPKWAAVYLALTAASLITGAAGLLRVLSVTSWSVQAIFLMFIPILYLAASHVWRGRQPEWPLYWVAHAGTAVILGHVLVAALESLQSLAPVRGEALNLRLGVVFGEATLFYLFAAVLRKRGINVYLAAAAACGAVWQFLGYFSVPSVWNGVIFASLGVSLLAVSRVLGLQRIPIWREQGARDFTSRGTGLAAFQCGTGILLVAFLAAFIQGLGRLALGGIEWAELAALVLTVIAAGGAALLSPEGTWRRVHSVAGVALTALTFLTLNEFINLSGWQKLEIFCVVAGLLMLAAAHVARFRKETTETQDDSTSLGLWLGSVLATLPLLISTFYHRLDAGPSLSDELALVTVTILLLAAGLAWKTRATTIFGGGSLCLYLTVLVVSLAYRPQIAVGAYLAIGGVLLFAAGVLLSIYREKLLTLPDRIAKREGVFQVIDWR